MNAKDRKRAEDTIRAAARKNGVSAAEVRSEMNLAIAAAYQHAKETHDPAWDVWTKQPTPEEFLLWISSMTPPTH